MLLPLLAFVFVSLLVAAARHWRSRRRRRGTIERRLGEVAGDRVEPIVPDGTGYARDRRRALEAHRQAWRRGRRRRWASCSSGWSRPATAATKRSSIFFGIRVGFALLCFFALSRRRSVMPPNLAASLWAACGVGYVLPGMVLARMAKRRQHRIRLGLADALDLLVVSVEAGLGLDQAIQRVGAGAGVRAPGPVATSCG